MSNINVAIADDNEQIRQNLQEIISKEKDMTLVGSAPVSFSVKDRQKLMVLTLCL